MRSMDTNRPTASDLAADEPVLTSGQIFLAFRVYMDEVPTRADLDAIAKRGNTAVAVVDWLSDYYIGGDDDDKRAMLKSVRFALANPEWSTRVAQQDTGVPLHGDQS